jgi:predicted metal-dependent hydrolase
LYGIDLFNHGYYWEAHEVWEGLWHACGRKGQTADFLKGLIKLAAAGVKVREGKPQGVRSHATRAEALLRLTARRSETAADRYMGLKSTELIQFARNLAHDADEQTARSPDAVRIVFDFILEPE